MTLIGDDLFVFGGRDNVSHFQDFYKFNIPSCRWIKMPMEKVSTKKNTRVRKIGNRKQNPKNGTQNSEI